MISTNRNTSDGEEGTESEQVPLNPLIQTESANRASGGEDVEMDLLRPRAENVKDQDMTEDGESPSGSVESFGDISPEDRVRCWI